MLKENIHQPVWGQVQSDDAQCNSVWSAEWMSHTHCCQRVFWQENWQHFTAAVMDARIKTIHQMTTWKQFGCVIGGKHYDEATVSYQQNLQLPQTSQSITAGLYSHSVLQYPAVLKEEKKAFKNTIISTKQLRDSWCAIQQSESEVGQELREWRLWYEK